MRTNTAQVLSCGLALLGLAHGHTAFSTLYVDGQNQGDGVSIRMNMDPSHVVDFIKDISSNDMACGVDGQTAVDRVSPAKAGSTLSFEYRVWADGSHPDEPAIDVSHKGPCTVFMKKVDDPLANNTAAGDGWFKIFEEAYDENTQQWCTMKMVANNGHLSAVIPHDLAPGYYLVRPELLALHQTDQTPPIPQFYVGCAQVFVQSSGTATPPTVTIPQNYVNLNMPGMHYNLWAEQLVLPYPMYGPPVYNASSSTSNFKANVQQSGNDGSTCGSTTNGNSNGNVATSGSSNNAMVQTVGMTPSNVVAINGNWYGIELDSYSDETGCWNASAACWKQSDVCYATQQPTGYSGCTAWEGKCHNIDDNCNGGNYYGPPNKGKMLTPSPSPMVGGTNIIKRGNEVQSSKLRWASRP